MAWLFGLVFAAGCAGVTPVPTPPAAPAAPKVYGPRIDNGAVGVAPANGRTLFALYLIGSDLEDDLRPRNGMADELEHGGPVATGSATRNLKQLVEAYAALTEAERANVEVLVALGGSRKAGWQGIKYLDLPMLAADLADGQVGNGGPYLFADAQADMSDDAVFRSFLTRVQARGEGAGKVMVTLWDHGGAYLGVGPDTNHETGDRKGMLGLERIKAGLEATAFKADMIGFDACLMASVEVANALKGHFDYMVASEEVEPSHGWDYGLLVQAMAKQPTLSALDLGKRLVDDYIESPANQKSKARTLSVSDLRHVDGVVGRMDALAQTIRDRLDPEYQAVLTAAGRSQYFGREVEPGTEYSLDLNDFVTSLRELAPDTQPQSAAVTDAMKRLVAYARESGEKPRASGLSIFSLVNVEFFDRGFYPDRVAATTNWHDYAGRFIARAKTAVVPPAISAETPAAPSPVAAFRRWLVFQAPPLGASDNASFRMTISATPGVANVSAMHVLQSDPTRHRYTVVSRERVAPDAQGGYTLKGWDGSAIHLTDDAGGARLAPFTFDTLTARGTEVFVAPARVNDEEASVYLEWDAQRGVAIDQWAIPFKPAKADGPGLIPKLQYELLAGDRVAFYESTIDTDADAKAAQLQPALTLASAPRWQRRHVEGQKLYFLYAQDLKGQVTASPLHLVVELLPGLDL